MRFSLLPTLALFVLAFIPLTRADDKAPPKAHDYAKWEKEIAAFEEADAKKVPPKNAIVFVGSSSIRMWKTLAEDFPKHQVINRGFGGSEIVDSTYFADRIVLPYAPRMIVFYAGGNDINAGKAPDVVVADFKAFVAKVREKLPKTEIAFISIAGNPARWAQVEKVKAVNSAVAAWIKDQPHMKYIDVFPKMLGEDGQPKDIFIADKLHMNADGYKIWVEVVRPFLPAPDL
jgi:lysophospholipase L1-like esterase